MVKSKFFLKIALLAWSPLLGMPLADACEFDPVNVDVLNIAPNSVRHPPYRGMAKNDSLDFKEEIASQNANVDYGVALAFLLEKKESFYTEDPDGGKIVRFYSNDDFEAGNLGKCDTENLNQHCDDHTYEEIAPTLEAWKGMEPRLVMMVHILNEEISWVEVLALEYAGVDYMDSSKTNEELIQDFLLLTKSHQCPGAGIGV